MAEEDVEFVSDRQSVGCNLCGEPGSEPHVCWAADPKHLDEALMELDAARHRLAGVRDAKVPWGIQFLVKRWAKKNVYAALTLITLTEGRTNDSMMKILTDAANEVSGATAITSLTEETHNAIDLAKCILGYA